MGEYGEKGMINISKIINNNVISTYDEEGKEIVVMGKGIAFQKKTGQSIDEGKIEKVFRMDNKETSNRFQDLLENLPLEQIQVSNMIISHAKEVLDVEMNQNIYITLTDHINFAIERLRQGMVFQNALKTEVKMMYPIEYQIGKWALEQIEQKTDFKLPDDEAASIALHIVNAEYNMRFHETCNITNLVQGLIEIITEWLGITMQEENHEMELLISNLKFLARRIFENKQGKEEDSPFLDMIEQQLNEEYQCSEMIGCYIQTKFNQELTRQEKVYLAIDIKRLEDGVNGYTKSN